MMRKGIRIIYFSIACFFMVLIFALFWPNGEISAQGKIKINNCTEIQLIGNDSNYPLNDNYILGKDIDCIESLQWNYDGEKYLGFNPIGTNIDPFIGIFDGQGHEIKNLFINRESVNYVALFAQINSGAKILNVGLRDINIKGNNYVGGFSGINKGGTIEKSYVSGEVTGFDLVGGFVGENWGGTIENSYATVEVNGERVVGGFVGENWGGTIENSYATGTAKGERAIGGFIGENISGDIKNCYSIGAVTGDVFVGKFAGINSDIIENSFSYKGDSENDCVGSGDSTGCEIVDEIENFYNYRDLPLKLLYDEWDFELVWSNIYIQKDYPIFQWQLKFEEDEKVKIKSAGRPYKVIPLYRNPLFSEKYTKEIKEIKKIINDVTEIAREIIVLWRIYLTEK